MNIIDGTYFIYRAYYVKEDVDEALHLLYRMLFPFKEDTAIVIDSDTKNFRHELFPEYKAGRPETPKALRKLKRKSLKLIKAMGFQVFLIDGHEGDDVIGTLARKAKKRKVKTTIHTGDKDIAQYLNKYVKIFDPRYKREITVKSLKEDLGITPKQVPDYLALVGDKVDNIPGVDGVGPVTATKLLTEHGNVFSIIEAIGTITPKTVNNKLEKNIDSLELSLKLTSGIKVPGLKLSTAFGKVKADREKVTAFLKRKR